MHLPVRGGHAWVTVIGAFGAGTTVVRPPVANHTFLDKARPWVRPQRLREGRGGIRVLVHDKHV